MERRVAKSGELQIYMRPIFSGAAISVRRHGPPWCGPLLMSMNISFFGDAEHFGGRPHAKTWVRTAEDGNWQRELFDAFSFDSHALLEADFKEIPVIITELLELPVWWHLGIRRVAPGDLRSRS